MNPIHEPTDRTLLANLPLIRFLTDKHAPAGERDDFRQELSCRLLQALERGVANPAAWLRATARNLAIDTRHLLRSARRAQLDEVAEPMARDPEPCDVAASNEAIAELRSRCADRPNDLVLLERLLADWRPVEMVAPAKRAAAEPGRDASATQRSRVFRLLRRLRGPRGNTAA